LDKTDRSIDQPVSQYGCYSCILPQWSQYGKFEQPRNCLQRGKSIVVLLCGGDKSTQAKDIKLAKRLAKELKG
jgi:hypothetical protein